MEASYAPPDEGGMNLLGDRSSRLRRQGSHPPRQLERPRPDAAALSTLRRERLAVLHRPRRVPIPVRGSDPAGIVAPTLFSSHDMVTVNEVFCREDYRAGPELEVVVDIGSNIGISALYFLTRSHRARVWLYEPVPANVERLRANLARFEGRWRLDQAAVADRDGTEPLRGRALGALRRPRVSTPSRSRSASGRSTRCSARCSSGSAEWTCSRSTPRAARRGSSAPPSPELLARVGGSTSRTSRESSTASPASTVPPRSVLRLVNTEH